MIFVRIMVGAVLVILQKKVAGLNEAALERFLRRARRLTRLRGFANVLVTGSSAIRRLNQQFRGKDEPTDVLSFPSSADESVGIRVCAGEIAISADIARENAERMGHSTAEEVKTLALHGILHLAGFDHERDNGRMARKEAELRRTLRLPTGLIERVQGRGVSSSQNSRKRSNSRQGHP